MNDNNNGGIRHLLHARSTETKKRLMRERLLQNNEKVKSDGKNDEPNILTFSTSSSILSPTTVLTEDDDHHHIPRPCNAMDAFDGIPIDDHVTHGAWKPPQESQPHKVQQWNDAYANAIHRIRETGAGIGGEQLRNVAK
eukprot:8735317-Ditylum_brightwellii.AAC.1